MMTMMRWRCKSEVNSLLLSLSGGLTLQACWCRNVITQIAEGTYDTGVQYPLSGQASIPTPSLAPGFTPAPSPASEHALYHSPVKLLCFGTD